MTKFNKCPNCGHKVECGSFFKVYECEECGTLYCHECGGKRCPDCGSENRKEAGECHNTD